MKDKSLTIEVTQDDIIRGQKGNCFMCPIAFAAERVLGGHIEVSFTKIIKTENNKIIEIYDLPDEAQEFILDFDHNSKKAKPFSFEL